MMYRSITALFLILASMSSWGQATVGFDLSGGSTFSTGETVTLNLVGNNWTDALGGGGVNFSFNSSVLELESVTINTSVFDLPQGACDMTTGACTTTGSGPGLVTNIGFSTFFNPSPTGTFDIASFQFLAESTGASNLGLSAGCCGLGFTDAAGNALTAGVDFSFLSQSVSVSPAVVTPVPEIDPTSVMSALTLLLGSLAVLRGGRAGRIVAHRF
jgi:hypothetical protein